MVDYRLNSPGLAERLFLHKRPLVLDSLTDSFASEAKNRFLSDL